MLLLAFGHGKATRTWRRLKGRGGCMDRTKNCLHLRVLDAIIANKSKYLHGL